MVRTKEEATLHLTKLTEILNNLGFTINKEKSSLVPSQTVNYLGFTINSKTMCIKLPNQKVKDVIKECKLTRKKRILPIRKLASLIRKISATTCVIFSARFVSEFCFKTRTMV